MTPVASAQQMRDIDRITIEQWGIASTTLMETAGHAVLHHLRCDFGRLTQKSVIIFCGKGNNAGDGLVLARMLIGEGCQLQVVLSHEKSEMSQDAQFNLELLEKMNFKCDSFQGLDLNALPKVDLLIDALLGTGIQGPVKGVFFDMIEKINQMTAPVYAIDLPSGMNTNSNKLEGPCIKATKTICIGAAKPACLYSPTRELCGQLAVEKIGFPVSLLHQTQKFLVDQKLPEWNISRPVNSHKGHCGKLLIYAGSKGMAGAAILSAKAAIHSGAAMVQMVCHEELMPIFQQCLPEMMVLSIPKAADSASCIILDRAENWADAFLIGPGLGQDEQTIQLVQTLVKKFKRPMIIDADGINSLKGHPELLRQRNSETVITPHPGEFKRLFGCEPAPLGHPILLQCQTLAQQVNITLHLKGAPSLTACPDGKVMINGSGNSILSTAGSGDVLSGIVGSFLSQKLSAQNAMCAAAYYHGRCADKLSEQGMIGHSAMDIAETLPRILHV